jgi:hypothetical protein
MQTILLVVALVLTPLQAGQTATAAQKEQFVHLLGTLPHDGEFFTEASITQAQPYLPVLLALTDADLATLDLYPFLAMSRGLCDRAKSREYVVARFGDIQHSTLKLFWAAMIFDSGSPTAEVVRYLRNALDSPAQVDLLSQAVGPDFEQFRAKVIAAARSAER